MELSKNNQKVVNLLRDKQLTYLIKPFKKMIELDQLGKIKIHKMTWKSIMSEVYNEYLTRADLEILIISLSLFSTLEFSLATSNLSLSTSLLLALSRFFRALDVFLRFFSSSLSIVIEFDCSTSIKLFLVDCS